MKLRVINDGVSDERRKIVTELDKLSKAAELAAVDELHTLLKDPVGMVRHTLKGIKADFSLLDDESWWQQMFAYWDHLGQEFLAEAYENVYTDVVDRVKKAAEAGVVIESKIGGFLGIIAKIGLLFLMLAFGSKMGHGYGHGYGRHRHRRNLFGNRRNRNTRSRDARADLSLGSGPAPVFEIRRLNPYIVYKFVELCVNETKSQITSGKLRSFDDSTGVGGDLEAEREMPNAAEEPEADVSEVPYPADDDDIPF